MNKKAFSAAMIALWPLYSVNTASAFQCNVCHSKNPAMVRMHGAVQEKGIGCFDCHKAGEQLMGKAEPKETASLLARRSAERPCLGCHTQAKND